MTPRAFSPLLAFIALACLGQTSHALSIGQVDDFEDHTTQGWTVGVGGMGISPNPPDVFTDGGPGGDGDAYLRLTSSGTATAGGRLVVISDGRWGGNYPALGLTSITMDVKNFGGTDLSLRLFLENPLAGPPTDTAVTQAVFLPAGSDWTPISFALDPATLVPLTGDLETLLGNVTLIRLFHGTAEAFPPEPITALLGVDNITAVPAPGALILLGTGIGALVLRARHQ